MKCSEAWENDNVVMARGVSSLNQPKTIFCCMCFPRFVDTLMYCMAFCRIDVLMLYNANLKLMGLLSNSSNKETQVLIIYGMLLFQVKKFNYLTSFTQNRQMQCLTLMTFLEIVFLVVCMVSLYLPQYSSKLAPLNTNFFK